MEFARLALTTLALAGLLPLPCLGQSSPTLLVDLNTSPDDGLDPLDGEVQVRGSALDQLWLDGVSAEATGPLFSVTGSGGTPVAVQLPVSPESGLNDPALTQVTDLGQGRALLFVRNPGSLAPTIIFGTDGTPTGAVDLGIRLLPSPPQVTGVIPTGPSDLQLSQQFPGFGYLVGKDASGTSGIFATDGTLAGTTLLLADPRILRVRLFNGALIYARRTNSSAFNDQLFSLPETGGASTMLLPSTGGQVDFAPVELGDLLLFAWRDQPAPGGTGTELWATDGSVAGTQLVLDLRPGQASSGPSLLAANGTIAYLAATTDGEGRELWRTDGTAAGTNLIIDQLPGPDSDVAPRPPSALAGQRLVYRMTTAALGSELFVSDGTAAGTGLLADLVPGPGGSKPTNLRSIADRVFFAAQGPNGLSTAFSTDGQSVLPAGSIGTNSIGQEPSGFTLFQNRVWYAATGPDGDREPYSTAPDGADFQAEMEVGVATENGSSVPSQFVRAGDRGYFSALASDLDSHRSLFVTDGTAAGTQVLLSPGAPLELLGALDTGLLLQTTPGGANNALYFSDGTAAGTLPLQLSIAGVVQSVRDISTPVQLGAFAYMTIDTVQDGRELWRTDGTQAGTARVVEFAAGQASALADVLELEQAGDRLFLATSGAPSSSRMWSSDGTQSGTFELAPALLASHGFRLLQALGDELMFVTTQVGSLGGINLWSTDGTDAGTQLLTNNLGPITSLRQLGAAGLLVTRDTTSISRLLSVGLDGQAIDLLQPLAALVNIIESGPDGASFKIQAGPQELNGTWFTDGTPAGTVRLLENSTALPRIGTGAESVFTRSMFETGAELWLTDGTVAGTAPFLDSNPGPGSAFPAGLGRIGNQYLFRAYTVANGFELHSIQVAQAGGYAVEPFGFGCGPEVFPDLALLGELRLGESVVLETSDGQPVAPTFVFASASVVPGSLGACTSYLSQPLLVGSTTSDAAGIAALPIQVSTNPAFLGLALYLRGASVSPSGPQVGEIVLTNGLGIVFGQ